MSDFRASNVSAFLSALFTPSALAPRLFLILFLIQISGCALTPAAPLSVQQLSSDLPVDASTFSVVVHPAPARAAFLRSYESVLIRAMKAKGYQPVESGGDLLISLGLQRTGWVRDLSKPVETGRLVFRLDMGDQTIRMGRSGSLSSNDLDFPRADARRERIRLFLDGL